MYVVKAGTAPGPYHLRRGEPNQDACAHSLIGDITVLVAADGAGSQKLSHLGSRLVVSSIVEHLRSSEGELSARLESAVWHARESLLEQPDSDKMGCTLAVLALSSEGWASATVGDAFGVIANDNGGFDLITAPPTEYFDETTFMNSASLELVTRSGDVPPRAAAVATDGFELVGLKNGEAFPAFWSFLFNRATHPDFTVGAVIQQMESQGRLTDDSTLVLAVQE